MERLKNAIKWIGTDGLLHIETVALIVALFTPLIGYGWALLAAIMTGLCREAIQHLNGRNTTEQVHHDIICNAIGLLLGTLIASIWFIITGL